MKRITRGWGRACTIIISQKCGETTNRMTNKLPRRTVEKAYEERRSRGSQLPSQGRKILNAMLGKKDVEKKRFAVA